MENFKSTTYKNQFTRDNYDRINFTAPKGYKEKINKRAKELGHKSTGEYIKSLIGKDLLEKSGGGIQRMSNLLYAI